MVLDKVLGRYSITKLRYIFWVNIDKYLPLFFVKMLMQFDSKLTTHLFHDIQLSIFEFFVLEDMLHRKYLLILYMFDLRLMLCTLYTFPKVPEPIVSRIS